MAARFIRPVSSALLIAAGLPAAAFALPVVTPVDDAGNPLPLPSRELRTPLERKPVLPPPAAPALPGAAEPAQPRAALPPVLERMGASEDPVLRQRAVEGIAALPPGVSAPALLRMAADPEELVRGAALDALQPLDAELVAEELLSLLESPEGWPLLEGDTLLQPLSALLGDALLALFVNENAPQPRRLLAAYCLGQMRHAPAAEALRHVMWNDTGELAYACVDALYWLDDPRSLEDWVRLTENADPWVLAYATAALARSGAQESIEPLYAIASGQNPAPPEVQRQALAGLAAWPGSVSVPYLINILRSNQRIQPETINALRKVAQVDVGRYPASWFEWYRQWSEVQAVAGQEEGSAPPLMPSQGDSELLNTVKFVPPGFSPGAN